MPVTRDLAAFCVHDLALIQTVPLVDSPRDGEVRSGVLVEFSVDNGWFGDRTGA